MNEKKDWKNKHVHTKTYGLKVEQALKPSMKVQSKEIIQYYITEDDLPIYEVNRWLDVVSAKSYKTGGNYAYKLLAFLRFLKAKYEIHYREVEDKSILEDYVRFLLHGDEVMVEIEGVRSFNSILEYVSVLKGFYEWLEDEGEIEKSPVPYGKRTDKRTGKRHLKKRFLYGQIYNFDLKNSQLATGLRFREKRSHIKWYSETQIERIIEALPTRRDKLVYKVLVYTGMRIGECMGIHLDHFNIHKRTLEIVRNMDNVNRATPKTKERTLYLSQALTDELIDYINSERVESDPELSDFLFLNYRGPNRGKPLGQKNFLKILKTAAKKAGFKPEEIITHSGRSTHAQYLLELLEEGVITEQYILEEMGWESIDTLKIYSKMENLKKRSETAQDIAERRIQKPHELGKDDLVV
ncbi:site-specific integrase [Ectobacillus funiculus]|uniref:tyrosine-type recombinase/integrase n=1 Tax=Ectobacillus funiculus TaxID=137993 RepID=UPI00397AF033